MAAQDGEPSVKGGVADAAERPQLCDGEGSGGVGKSGGNAVIERHRGGVVEIGTVGDGQSERITVGGEGERDRVRRRSSAVLDGESEIIAVTAQIEVAVTPGMELGRSAQSLAVTEATGALLGVVDDGDGELMLALEVAQKGEQGSDLGGRILVDAMQADEGVEDQQAGRDGGDGRFEPGAIVLPAK